MHRHRHQGRDTNYEGGDGQHRFDRRARYTVCVSVAADPPTIALGSTSALSTTGGSGTGATSYAVTAGEAFCSVVGDTLTGIGAGTCAVTATKAADANFEAATATVEVTITRADQSALNVAANPATIAFGSTSALSVTGGSGTGAINYAVTTGASFCTIVDDTLTGTGVGNCIVTATKAADADYEAASASVGVSVQAAATCVSPTTTARQCDSGAFVEYDIRFTNAGPLDVFRCTGAERVAADSPTLVDITPIASASCPSESAAVRSISGSICRWTRAALSLQCGSDRAAGSTIRTGFGGHAGRHLELDAADTVRAT